MISIIIPVYNTKKELIERCINSILRSEFDDFEIIIVNDGSKKECSNYIEKLKNIDKRIQVFHQKNQGVSAARNNGIRFSKGDYIAFVDADDEVNNRYLTQALNYLIENDLDIIIGGLKYKYAKYSKEYRAKFDNHEKLKTYDVNKKMDLLCHLIEDKATPDIYELENCRHGAVYAKLYRKSILEKISFNEQLFRFEDKIFNIDAFIKAKRIGVIDDVWYTYYQYSDSSIHKSDLRIIENNCSIMHVIQNKMQNLKKIKSTIYRYYLFLVYDSFRGNLNIIYKWKAVEKFNEKMRKWINDDLWNEVIKEIEVDDLQNYQAKLLKSIGQKSIFLLWLNVIYVAVANLIKGRVLKLKN